jgi:hypothetical protein
VVDVLHEVEDDVWSFLTYVGDSTLRIECQDLHAISKPAQAGNDVMFHGCGFFFSDVPEFGIVLKEGFRIHENQYTFSGAGSLTKDIRGE